MTKKNDPTTLTLPDIGEGGNIVPGAGTVRAVAELLSARGQLTLFLRPVPKEQAVFEINFSLHEAALSSTSVDNLRGNLTLHVIIEGRDGKGEYFIAAVEWYLSAVNADAVEESFPMLNKAQAKALASFFTKTFELTGQLERAAAEERKKTGGFGIKDDTRVLVAKEEAEKPGLKIKLRTSDD